MNRHKTKHKNTEKNKMKKTLKDCLLAGGIKGRTFRFVDGDGVEYLYQPKDIRFGSGPDLIVEPSSDRIRSLDYRGESYTRDGRVLMNLDYHLGDLYVSKMAEIFGRFRSNKHKNKERNKK